MPDGMTAKGVPMTMTEELIKVLGGQGTIKKRVDSLQDLANIVREGIPFPSLLALSAMAHLDLNTMSRVLMIPTRTLARRRKAKRLSAEESVGCGYRLSGRRGGNLGGQTDDVVRNEVAVQVG